MWVLATQAWGFQFRSSEPAEKTRLTWQYMFVTKYRGAGYRRIPGGGWPSRLAETASFRFGERFYLKNYELGIVSYSFNPSSWEGEANLIWIASSSVSRVIQWYFISSKTKYSEEWQDDTWHWHLLFTAQAFPYVGISHTQENKQKS